MLRARYADEKAIILYKQSKAHFQIGCSGHEAVQIATALSMDPEVDYSYPYYRDLAYVLGLGFSVKEFFLGCMNKADCPASGGRQMPMHYGHKELNIPSQSSPTGTQFLQAVGAAWALRYKQVDGVVYVSAGEGTTAQGDYHEALNWAARELLPVIFLIQNNQFAISVHISEQLAGSTVAKLSAGYQGLDVQKINGLDFEESYKAAQKATRRARQGKGPSLIVADTVRLQSHSISDNQAKYRTPEEIVKDQEKDPLKLFEERLLDKKTLSKEEIENLHEVARKEIDDAARWADEQPDPEPETANKHVLRDSYPRFEEGKMISDTEVHMVDSLNHALDEELERNEDMVIYGQDVAGGKGGVFSVTSQLTDRFGYDRVFNSPLAESSIIGTAVGMATVGIKPVVEIQFGDYIWTGMMQLRNELCMMYYRSNGNFSCPAVIRVAVGGYIKGALYHSQNIEATFSHFPGLLVVYPSNATDAKALLKSAIRCSDPVLFLEHKGLYRQVYAKGAEGGVDDLAPLGKAKIVREGIDVTVITWGMLVHHAKRVADKLAKDHQASVEVIDLRTLSPLDLGTIELSIKKTGKVLVCHEDIQFMGFGAEVCAQIAENCFDYLDAPICRHGGQFSPIPHAPALEKEILPQEERLLEKLKDLLEY